MANERSFRLKSKESPTEGMRRIAWTRAEKAIEELAGTEAEAGRADSVHATRKDLKKIRGVVRLVRAELGDDLYRAANRRYRDAGRLLSRSRDAEVKVETLKALRKLSGDELPADLVSAWLVALERDRGEVGGLGADQEDRSLEEAKAAIEGGQEEIDSWPLRHDSWRLVEAGLLHSYRRGRRTMKRTSADPIADNVHEWRKRTKDLWYQLRVLRDAWRPVLGETVGQAHELADLLGDHHDLAVLADDLRDRRLSGDRESVKHAIEQRQDELLASAFAVGARLFAEKPKAFGKRLEAYWLAWRPS
jgi:CHAD domain-containing protein